MSIENLDIAGLRLPSGTTIDNRANPTGQSRVVDMGKHVLITRPLSPVNTGMPPMRELENRVKSTRLYEKAVPDLVPKPTQIVVLQGYGDGSPQGEQRPVPVFARFTDKLNRVEHVSDFDPDDVLSDDELRNKLVDINTEALKRIVKDSVLMDTDLMVGFKQDGSRVIFCDPDWAVPVSLAKRVKVGLKFFRDALYYKFLDKLHNIPFLFTRKPKELKPSQI